MLVIGDPVQSARGLPGLEGARRRAVAGIEAYAAALRSAEGAALGEGLIQTRALKDRVEAIFVEGLQRFDKSGEYAADGAVDVIAWLRSRCRVSGADAAQRLGVARQLDHLPGPRRPLPPASSGCSMWPR